METKVVNKHKEQYDIDITRNSNSKFKNPYIIGVHGNRTQVIAKFKIYSRNIFTYDDLIVLKNKRLGCVCHPKKCHGDILIELMYRVGILEELF